MLAYHIYLNTLVKEALLCSTHVEAIASTDGSTAQAAAQGKQPERFVTAAASEPDRSLTFV